MAEPARFEARGRAGFDEATIVRATFVDAARKRPGLGAVERAAARPVVSHEPKPRWTRLENGVFGEKDRAESLLVVLEEVHRTRAVMAAAPARHAVGPIGIGRVFEAHEGSIRHGGRTRHTLARPNADFAAYGLAPSLLYGVAMTSRLFFFALVAAATVACGGKTDDVIVDGGGDGPINGDSGPGPGPSCPASAPNPSSACSIDGIQCEYGTDPRWTCNTVAMCMGGTWLFGDFGGQGCPTVSGSDCPAAFSDIHQGDSCTETNAPCNYSSSSATEFCICGSLGGPVQLDGGHDQWQCSAPQEGCPAAKPHLGATCAQANLQCDYSVCGEPNGLSVQCDPSTSTWVEGPTAVCAMAN